MSGMGLAALPAQAIAVALTMPVNFIGNKLWTFDCASRRASALAASLLISSPAVRRRRRRGAVDHADRSGRTRVPADHAGGLRGHGDQGAPDRRRHPRGRRADRQPRAPDDRDRGQRRRALAGRLQGRRRRGCPGQGRRAHRGGHRGADRLPGRLADGARLRGPVRPRAQRPLRLDPAGADLPARPVRLPPACADRPPRPARPALVRDLAVLLQPRRDRGLGPARLPAARLPAGADALDRLARRRRGPAPIDAGRAGSAIAAIVPDRLPGRRSTSPTRG